MLQGSVEVGGPLWGWDGDGDDDWDGAVLTLLALAVVATIALALQWFGSRQDQEAQGSASTAPGVQPAQAGGVRLALHLKSKDSDAIEGQSKGQEKSEVPGDGQKRPAIARAQDPEPSRGRSMASDAWLSLKISGEVASRGTTPATLGKKRRAPTRPETSFQGHQKTRDIPVPIMIRFTPRSPDSKTEMWVGSTGTCGEGAAQPGSVHTEQQDTSPQHLAVGPPGPLGRSLGSLRRRRRPGASSGDRPRRPLKLDPLRLGTVVSVWDAVDMATAATQDIVTSSSLAGPSSLHSDKGLKGPEQMGLADAVNSQAQDPKDVCGRSSLQQAPAITAGSEAKDDESREPGSPAPRETQGILAGEAAWSWKSGAAVVTSNFSPCQGALPEELRPEALEVDQVADQSKMEKLGEGHLIGKGRESCQGEESEQIAILITDVTKSSGGFSCIPSHNLSASPLTQDTELVPSSAMAVHSSPGFLHAVSTLAPLNNLPLEVSQGPSGGENLKAEPASIPSQTLASAEASASAPEAILAPFSISPPTSTSAPSLTPAPVTTLTPVSTPTPSPTSPPTPASALVVAQAPAVDSGPRPMSRESSVGLSKSSLEGRISTSWGNLITMVLRSHPFPRQEKADGSAPRAYPQSPAGSSTSTYLEDRQPGPPSEGAISSLQDKHGPLSVSVTTVGSGSLAEGRCETQPMNMEMNVSSAPDHKGDETKEKSLDPLPPAAKPEAVSQFPVPAQPGPVPSTVKQDAQPIPQPRQRRKRSIAQSSEQILSQEVSQQPQGQVLKDGSRPASRRDILTEKQKETRKLMVFLQKPGSWGVVEGPQKSCSRVSPPTTATALWPPKLDLGSCLEVLAFAQKHGELGLAQDTYVLMSNNLLHVLGDPQLYRQLSGADRERILNLRTCQGQTVLGVLELPGLYQMSRSGLTRGPHSEETPATRPEHLYLHTYLHVFNPQENVWRPLTQVPEEVPLRGCGLCTMHNYLFLAGGIRGSGAKAVCSNKVFCYNPLTNIWSQIRPMQQARAQLKLVALDGMLYAIGGECLYSMERYDPRTDTWTLRASLPEGTFPVAHEAVVCRGDIYVTGGHLFYRLLRYSPVKDSWDECPYSASHRRSSDMVALGGFLYRFDLLRGVGAAVMRYNTVTGSWSRAASLPLPDPAPLHCTVLGNTIYCLNHQVTATFTVSEGTAQFQAKELQPFPQGNKGVLYPFTLTLPPKTWLQTTL
ncbi:kelch domain-containing protein 7B isoform X2 [Cricetulus griseus]|uniref:Kelch domain-containing protein 7B isoform X2 n=3 Tax=Cricetulus griseus TaxID=10029 RepID=A0A9J7J9Q5_CRIGR|nr:kelch domain-containing protein 7B isoform X2 [Cricetulus griseus]ERE86413.1 kelch domain-containing protein 7B-like protein [Cricetulus griseus]